MVTVKICGVRTLEAAQHIEAAGADYAGLLFVPGRKREVSLETAKSIRAELQQTEAVGVFMNSPIDHLRQYASELQLKTVQLHGNESPEYVETLSEEGLNIIRAFSWTGSPEYARYGQYRDNTFAYLFDGPQPGSGQSLDKNTFYAQDLRLALNRPIWLAGGLNPENIEKVLETHALDGVDVASGIETNGEQDPKRISAFINAAKRKQ